MEIKPLSELGIVLDLEGNGRTQVPYLGWIECQFELPVANNFKGDQLMLVVPDSKFGKIVPIQVGTVIQTEIMNQIPIETLKENSKLSPWILCGALSKAMHIETTTEMDGCKLRLQNIPIKIFKVRNYFLDKLKESQA